MSVEFLPMLRYRFLRKIRIPLPKIQPHLRYSHLCETCLDCIGAHVTIDQKVCLANIPPTHVRAARYIKLLFLIGEGTIFNRRLSTSRSLQNHPLIDVSEYYVNIALIYAIGSHACSHRYWLLAQHVAYEFHINLDGTVILRQIIAYNFRGRAIGT